MKAALALAILLAACNQAPAPPAANQIANAAPASVRPWPPPAAKPFALDVENELVEYHYGWSAEAAAVPELVARFRAAMEKDKAELIANAKEDKASRAKDGYPFHAYSSSTDYATAGQSPRLLSLLGRRQRLHRWRTRQFRHRTACCGTAAARKEIEVADLFDPPTRFAALVTKPWCAAINAERIKKREEQPVSRARCSGIAPRSTNSRLSRSTGDKDGRFEAIRFSAAPYVAGPYVEGQYDVDLPVDAAMLRRAQARLSRLVRGFSRNNRASARAGPGRAAATRRR